MTSSMKRYLLILMTALMVSLLCQCSSCSVPVQSMAPPKLGNAAPRSGSSVVVYSLDGWIYAKNRIYNKIDESSTLINARNYSYADYVVNLSAPSILTGNIEVGIFGGGFRVADELPPAFNFDSCMQRLATKTFTQDGIGQQPVEEWVAEQILPRPVTHHFNVEYSGKPELKAVCHCIINEEWDEAAQTLKEYVSEHPDDAEGFYVGGIILVCAKQYDTAESAFRKAGALKPDARYSTAISTCRSIANEAEAVRPFLR